MGHGQASGSYGPVGRNLLSLLVDQSAYGEPWDRRGHDGRAVGPQLGRDGSRRTLPS